MKQHYGLFILPSTKDQQIDYNIFDREAWTDFVINKSPEKLIISFMRECTERRLSSEVMALLGLTMLVKIH